MPATKANSTSFRKGNTPWNAGRRENVVCGACGKEFSVPLNRLAQGRSVSCSKRCANELMSRRGLATDVMRLYGEGKTAQEIAAILKRPVVTVYSHVNRRKYRFRQPGLSRAAITNQLLKGKSCVVCGWTRCLDAAHYIPARDGGTMEIDNIVPLCPNHHRLFDKKSLLPDELYRIEEYRNAQQSPVQSAV